MSQTDPPDGIAPTDHRRPLPNRKNPLFTKDFAFMNTFITAAWRIRAQALAGSALLATAVIVQAAPSAPALDPLTIPKYVTPLVIPPEMPTTSATGQPCTGANCPAAKYNLSMRQFQQQVLPGGPFNVLTGRSDSFPATAVWGYGRQEDPVAKIAPAPAATSSFNYPAFTVENKAGAATSVRWINELVAIDPATGKPYPHGSPLRTFLPHITPTDPTMHWANPGKAPCLPATPGLPAVASTDCTPDPTLLPKDLVSGAILPYSGPVPNVTHVHGAEDLPESDGYAEAWWLPDASNIPAGYALTGREYDQANRSNLLPGSAFFNYGNTQPQTTLWYHDHTLGITHNNVYAGGGGFWLIRSNPASGVSLYANDISNCKIPGGASPFSRPTNPLMVYSSTTSCGTAYPKVTAKPGCDPNFDLACRAAIREIPLVLQDRSFLQDGSLFYSGSRDDANAIAPGSNVTVPYAPASDIAPIINPEFFATALVVNGTTYPTLQVAPQRYRFRLLDGADARSFNVSLWALNAGQLVTAHTLFAKANGGVDGTLPNEAYRGGVYTGLANLTVTFPKGTELPIYQIGAEQGFLPKVTKIMTGVLQALPGNPSYSEPALPKCVPAIAATATTAATPGSNPQDPNCERALLLTPGERADTVVDFSSLKAGSSVRMINTAQDSPFQGFPITDLPPTPGATDQLMEFAVVATFTNALNPAGVVPPPDVSVSAAKLETDQLAEKALTVPATATVRTLSLTEYESQQVCAASDIDGNVTSLVSFAAPQQGDFAATCSTLPQLPGSEPFGPRIDMLGQVAAGTPVPYHWADPISQTPTQNQVQVWDVYNYTPDSHPIHLHGTRFQVIERENLVIGSDGVKAAIPAVGTGVIYPRLATEAGYKDMVDALPRQRVRLAASFAHTGLYQWHCHISEHEDNEMMLPLCVVPAGSTASTCGLPATTTKGTPPPAAVPLSTAAQ
jgi:FtsP/CotA-like multicopper oxidase with cupredoxin domain